MKIALIAYSRKGQLTALKIAALLKDENVSAFCPERILDKGFQPISKPFNSFYGELFNSCDVLIFVGSTGIAVREIAPHVKSKTTDPAVISIDELGRFVIALLSGHIGGANAFALKLAEALGSTPVITTATDINGRFSVDAWAARQGLVIDNMKICKDISARILEKDLPLKSALPIKGSLPSGVFEGEEGELGIYIGTDIKTPFKETLRLIPKTLSVGIGCRKGISKELINDAVNKVFEESNLDKRAVKGIYSIDIKSEEAGLLVFCKGLNIEPVFYSAEELKALEGAFSASDFVAGITGVDNVCERAALMNADKLIVKKTALNGVTVAVGEKHTEVCFE